jgi:hypothetical protein
MSAARMRVIGAVAVLAVLAAAGVVWLYHVANGAGRPETPAGLATAVPGGTSPTAGASAGLTVASPVITTAPVAPRPSAGGRPPVPSAGTPPVPSRAIRVGGVTLDNTNPRTPCVAFKNTAFGVPVRVTAVVVSEADLVISSSQCADDDNIRGFPASRACAPGQTLPPAGDGCYAGIRAKAGSAPADYHGTVRLTLATRCTTGTVAPCSDDELRASPPSPQHPVDVTWTDDGKQACFRVEAPDPSASGPPVEFPFCQ